MFLNCKGYTKDTEADCRTYSANGKLNHANRYDIRTAISTTSVKNIISPLFPSLYILTLQPAYGIMPNLVMQRVLLDLFVGMQWDTNQLKYMLNPATV